MDGRLIKRYNIAAKGQGSINVSSKELSAGTYTYTMYIDDKILDTKLMVITSED